MTGSARRVAAIDCGTNSLRLLIADVDPARGTLAEVIRQMEITRLGQGVDATGALAPAALERTLAVLARYAAAIADSGAGAVRMAATSATRDAANAAEFTRGVTGVLGVAPEVLTGQQEAELSFAGATRELAGTGPGRLRDGEPGATGLAAAEPYLVVDIGGGSTEFVMAGPGEGAAPAALSADIGCVRLTERHLHADPPSAAQVAAATADIDAALAQVREAVPVDQAATLIGLAGSVTTVTGIALGLPRYEPSRIHHARVPASQVHQISARLLSENREQRASIGVMHPGRVDVIAAGALILDRILAGFGFRAVLASEHDILDGIAWSAAGAGQ